MSSQNNQIGRGPQRRGAPSGRSHFLGRLLVVVTVLGLVMPAWATSQLGLRAHNPMTQVYGIPTVQGGYLLPEGASALHMDVSLVTHADAGGNRREQLVLDGETYQLNLGYAWALNDRWMLSIDVPWSQYSGGFMDSTIEEFHQLIGADNSQRDGPKNRMRFFYARDGVVLADVDGGAGGLGDIRLGATYRLSGGIDSSYALVARLGVKLPTGEAEELTGSGATDVALSLGYDQTQWLGVKPLSLHAEVGVVALGNGDVLPDQQESTVYFGGLGVSWAFNERWQLMTQFAASSALFDSDLAELGSRTVQLGIGLAYQPAVSPWRIRLGFVEDVWSDVTPDFGLQFEFEYRLGGR